MLPLLPKPDFINYSNASCSQPKSGPSCFNHLQQGDVVVKKSAKQTLPDSHEVFYPTDFNFLLCPGQAHSRQVKNVATHWAQVQSDTVYNLQIRFEGCWRSPVYLIIKVSYGLLTRLSIQVHAPISPLKITLPQSHSGSQIKRWTSKLVIPLQLSDAQVLSDTKSQI